LTQQTTAEADTYMLAQDIEAGKFKVVVSQTFSLAKA
jgi:hypothetical protein